jgi:hypothetical protein
VLTRAERFSADVVAVKVQARERRVVVEGHRERPRAADVVGVEGLSGATLVKFFAF